MLTEAVFTAGDAGLRRLSSRILSVHCGSHKSYIGASAIRDQHYMRVFLDDERPTPEGWVRCHWPEEVIALLQAGGVTEISLDHDLGDDERGTGYDVILWIEEAVALHGFIPPKLAVHSANASARLKMLAGVDSIARLSRRYPQFSQGSRVMGAIKHCYAATATPRKYTLIMTLPLAR